MKKIYLLLLMFFISWPIISQENYNEIRKLSFSLDLGYPFYNYNDQLNEVFIDQAFNEPTRCWSFIFPCENEFTQHLRTSSSPYFGIDISYLLPNMQEVGLQISILNRGDITGYQERYKYLSLDFKKNSFTPYYRILNLSQRIQFDMGIPANFIKFEFEKPEGQEYFKPGLFIGGKIGIIEKRSYSVRLTAQTNWVLGTVKIEPYEMTYSENGNQITEIGFREEKIKLKEIFFIISYVRKF